MIRPPRSCRGGCVPARLRRPARGTCVCSAAQSRKLDRNPCVVMSARFIRLKAVKNAWLESGLAAYRPGNTNGRSRRQGPRPRQNLHAARRQGDAVIDTGLHANARNGPRLRCEVDFAPCGAQRLRRTRRAEDRQFKAQPHQLAGVRLTQGAEKGWHLGIRQRRMVDLARSVLRQHLGDTPRWVVTGTVALGRAPVKDDAKTPKDAAGRIWTDEPARTQGRQNVGTSDRINPFRAERRECVGER